MDSGIKRAVAIWHRRSGKDKTALNITIKKMLERVGTYYYFAPTYAQGKKIIWEGIDKDGFRFLDHFPKDLIDGKPNDTELKIRLKNGSLFQIIGTDKIDAIVGTNPVGCVFTEYSLQRPDAWQFIRPILAENGGWAIFIFTPRGMNHGYQILEQAKVSDGWFWEVLPVSQTNAISPQVLEEEKRQMPEDLFNQEYNCAFLEGASQFFRRIDKNLWSGELTPEANRTYQLGVDLAKYQDWTVITPFDCNDFKVGKPERFQQIDYNLQKAKIESMFYRFNKAQTWIDSTGVGEPVYDDLVARGLAVEPYKFSEKSRMDLLNHLSLLIEQDRIKLPDDPILLGELRAFQYELSEKGKLKVGVPEGLHDDTVMSLALSVWGRTSPVPLNTTEEFNLYGSQKFN